MCFHREICLIIDHLDHALGPRAGSTFQAWDSRRFFTRAKVILRPDKEPTPPGNIPKTLFLAVLVSSAGFDTLAFTLTLCTDDT